MERTKRGFESRPSSAVNDALFAKRPPGREQSHMENSTVAGLHKSSISTDNHWEVISSKLVLFCIPFLICHQTELYKGGASMDSQTSSG